MENEKLDRRKITSPINGRKGGRPRSWELNPYQMIVHLRQNPTPTSAQDIRDLQKLIARRRRARLNAKLKKSHVRPDLALRDLAVAKERRQKKLTEIRYLRLTLRKLLAEYDSIGTDVFDGTERKPKNLTKK